MPLISAEDLHLSYGPKKIFAGDGLAVEPGDRLGVVGPNGAGKSTLLRILAGDAHPDAGRVTRAKGIRVGYLAQEHGSAADAGLLEAVLDTAPGKEALEARLSEVEQALAEAADEAEQVALAGELAELHGQLARLEQDFGAHRAQAILRGLGFSEEQFGHKLTQFSGGWRVRAALGALLYQQPDVLLLDEPTNHLDLPSVQWLSGFLGKVRHAVVLTCHDREFLNRHIRRVASLELEGIRSFRGDYDAYLEQRTLDIAHLAARAEKEAERKKRLEAFVDRFRAKATKARQAQSRVKMLERLEAEQVELPQLRRALHVRFAPVARASERVLDVRALRFGYEPGAPVLDGVDLEVRRGDRVAIVGVNGAGKTTLLRLLAGELSAEAGSIEFGRGVSTSYFAQHHGEALALGRTIIEEVRAAAPEASETRVRSLCGAVLFGEDDVDKRVGVLSGGEKARVALARMLARPANLLLLDEPTNHLDTESAEVLTESLEGFDGTLLFVSHDLDFARRLSTRVFDVSGGRVHVHPGTLGDYLDGLAERQADLEATFATHGLEHARDPKPSAKAAEPEDKAARLAAREKKKRADADAKRLQKALEVEAKAAEDEVGRLEAEKAQLEAELADPDNLGDPDVLERASARFAAVAAALEAALERWTEAEAAREEAEAQMRHSTPANPR